MKRKQREFLEPERFASAPKLPADRAPTKKEVWDRELYLYSGLLPHEEIVARAKQRHREYTNDGRCPTIASAQAGTLPKIDPKEAWHERTRRNSS